MIVYAYYGLGKTTLCQTQPHLFTEIDEEYLPKPYDKDEVTRTIQTLSQTKIVFINGRLGLLPDIHMDAAMFPEDVTTSIKRLENRQTDPSFASFLKETFHESKDLISARADCVWLLSSDAYVSDYQTLLLLLNQQKGLKSHELENLTDTKRKTHNKTNRDYQ